jgi:hypothetical protein
MKKPIGYEKTNWTDVLPDVALILPLEILGAY